MLKLSAILVVAVVALASHTCQAARGFTTCESWKGSTEIRCAKDDAPFDRVRVTSKTGARITFRIGKWVSSCGWPGSEYSNESYEVQGQQELIFDMERTDWGKCREAFIFQCKLDGSAPANCLDALSTTRV